MTQPLPPELTRFEPPSFAELMEAEAARVQAGEPGCGHVCLGACHGGHACLRLAHGDDQAHVGRLPSGQLVQWHTCDEDTHAAALVAAEQAKADNAERTKAFLAGLDQDTLRDFMDGAAR